MTDRLLTDDEIKLALNSALAKAERAQTQLREYFQRLPLLMKRHGETIKAFVEEYEFALEALPPDEADQLRAYVERQMPTAWGAITLKVPEEKTHWTHLADSILSEWFIEEINDLVAADTILLILDRSKQVEKKPLVDMKSPLFMSAKPYNA